MDEGAVAVLEDPQGNAHAREEHGVEREHRERVAHGASLRSPPMGGCGWTDAWRTIESGHARPADPPDRPAWLRRARGLPQPSYRARSSTWTRRSRWCARSARPSGPVAPQAIEELSLRFDGVAPEHLRVPAAALAEALASLDPAVRAGLEESIRRLRATLRSRAGAGGGHRAGSGRPRHPPLRADPPGRPLRARRPGPAGLQRRDERRPGAGRGRRVDRAGQLAAEGPRRSARADHPGGVRAARRRRGVRRRRRAGDRDVRLRGGGVRAGRPGHRARQHLHRRGQAAAQGRGRHRLRGRADRDRDPGRRHRRRGVRRRRPDQPGRARPGRRQRAGHRLRAAGRRRRGRARASRSPRPGTPSGSAPRSAVGSPASCWSTTSSRGSRWSTPTPRSTSRSTPQDATDGRRPRAQRRRDLRRAVRPGVARRLLRRLQPRAADRGLRLPLLRAVGACLPQGGPRRRLRPRRAGGGRRTTWSRSPRPRTSRATAQAVSIRFQR